MKAVILYSTNNCPFCVAAKRLLESKNIAFEEKNLSGNPDELVALKNRTGMRTVPQIFVGDEFVGGFQELSALSAAGKLDDMLSS